MKIKNYTSKVPVVRTIAGIETLLAAAGASSITKEYGPTGQPVALTFQIEIALDRPLRVRLPADIEACMEALWRGDQSRRRRGRKQREEFREQAVRTAWRLQHDWVAVQLSLIQLKQLEPLQAFLAYVWDGSQTFYHRLRTQQFKALNPA